VNSGSDRPSRRWIALGALLLLALAVVGYGINHKPFLPPQAMRWGTMLWAFLIALLILTIAGGIGRLLFQGPGTDQLAALTIQAALGLGVLGIIWLLLALVGGMSVVTAWIALAVAILGLSKPCRQWLASLSALSEDVRQSGGTARWVQLALALLLVGSLLEAMAPAAHFDALVYHLALPRSLLIVQRLEPIAGNPYWGMPLTLELLYGWAMALAGPTGAAVLGWMIGVTALIGTLALGREFNGLVGWVAAAAMTAGSTLAASLGWAYADWMVALLGCAVLLALRKWMRDRQPATLMAAGALAGMALGTKYSSGWLGAAGLAVVMLVGDRRRWLRSGLAFCLPAVIAASPWLIKNWLITGAPLFPFIGASALISPLGQRFYRSGADALSLGSMLLAPWTATFGGVEGGVGFAASIGPLLAGLLPTLLLVPAEDWRKAAPAAWFALMGWITWIIAGTLSPFLAQSRLAIGFFPAWALLAGLGYGHLSKVHAFGIRFGKLAAALVVISLAFAALGIWSRYIGDDVLRFAMGLEDEQAYLEHRLGPYMAAVESIDRLPPGSRVQMLWEPRSFYCLPSCIPDAWLDEWYVERRQQTSTAAILADWRSAGANYLLVSDTGLQFVKESDGRYSPEDWQAFETMLSKLTLLGRPDGMYRLYRIGP
jgi:hypothetical protein